MGPRGYGEVVQSTPMMSTRPDEENANFRRWIKIQSEVLMPMGRRGERDALIGKAEGILADETDPAFRDLVIMGVSAILHVNGWERGSLAWCERRVGEAPDDPKSHNDLAMWYYANPLRKPTADELDQALQHSAKAVEKAREMGCWQRSVLHDRCRIATAAGKYDIVAEAMEEILEVWANPCEPDIPMFESDWLATIPIDAIENDLLERYRAAAGEA